MSNVVCEGSHLGDFGGVCFTYHYRPFSFKAMVPSQDCSILVTVHASRRGTCARKFKAAVDIVWYAS